MTHVGDIDLFFNLNIRHKQQTKLSHSNNYRVQFVVPPDEVPPLEMEHIECALHEPDILFQYSWNKVFRATQTPEWPDTRLILF